MGEWSFITNHADVLLRIARDSDVRLRDLAVAVGITERATQQIVNDLVTEGYVSRRRIGSRNRYHVNREMFMRRPIVRHLAIAELIALVAGDATSGDAAAGRRASIAPPEGRMPVRGS